jgi:hypothetical protein
MVFTGYLQSVVAIICRQDPVAVPVQVELDQFYRFDVIVNDQNLFPGHV